MPILLHTFSLSLGMCAFVRSLSLSPFACSPILFSYFRVVACLAYSSNDLLYFFNLYTDTRWCILLFSSVPLSISSLSIVYCHCCLHLCIWPLIFCSLARIFQYSGAHTYTHHYYFLHLRDYMRDVYDIHGTWQKAASHSVGRSLALSLFFHFNLVAELSFCFAQQFGFVYFIVVYVVVVQFILDLLVVIPKQLKHLCTHGCDSGLFPLTVYLIFFLSSFSSSSSLSHPLLHAKL